MYDYHVHSSFSNDCNTKMEFMVKEAIKRGIKEICFTDHVDQDYGDHKVNIAIDFDDWLRTFNPLKQKYRDQIVLKMGIELGIQPHLLKNSKALIESYDFDFVLMSMHTCDKKDMYEGTYYLDKTPEKAWLTYLDELAFCIEHYDTFNVVGHIDIVKRYNDQAAKYNITPLKNRFLEIFTMLADKNKGIEINTSGFVNPRINDSLPSVELLKWYREAGGKIITLGSDSHKPSQLGHRFNDVIKTLKTLGFVNLYTFKNLKPIKHAL